MRLYAFQLIKQIFIGFHIMDKCAKDTSEQEFLRELTNLLKKENNPSSHLCTTKFGLELKFHYFTRLIDHKVHIVS